LRRLFSLPLAALLVLGASRIVAQSESTTQPSSHRATWSFDPVHGTMHATPGAPLVVQGKLEAAPAASTTPTTSTGTIDITVTVKLVSTVPKGSVFHCSGGVGLEYSVAEQLSSSGSTTSSIGLVGGISQSTEYVTGTVSGSTAICSLSIPYSWTVPASSTTVTVLVNGITGQVGITEEVPTTTNGVTTYALSRSTEVELAGPATIPANGTTTTLTASTVL